MKLFLTIAVGLSMASDHAAGKKVSSRSCHTVLNIVLNHNVKEISVPEAEIREPAIFLDAPEKIKRAESLQK